MSHPHLDAALRFTNGIVQGLNIQCCSSLIDGDFLKTTFELSQVILNL